jgi:hypothetical protein
MLTHPSRGVNGRQIRLPSHPYPTVPVGKHRWLNKMAGTRRNHYTGYRPVERGTTMSTERLIKRRPARIAVAVLVAIPLVDGWGMIWVGNPAMTIIGAAAIIAALMFWAIQK